MAMLLAEAAVALRERAVLQVFATDLDDAGDRRWRARAATARQTWPTSRPSGSGGSSSGRPASYRVRRELRETVLFAHHNVLKDPPFSHLDLVCCRNLLIYLNRARTGAADPDVPLRAAPGGYLFLGCSESPDGTGDLFATVDKDAHIYEAANGLRGPSCRWRRRCSRRVQRQVPQPPQAARRASPSGCRTRDLHLRLLEQYAPPSIVVNDEHQVIHVSERAGQYLQVGGGELSRDLLRLVWPELRVELRTALYRATRDRVNVEVRGIEVTIEGQSRRINLGVRPISTTRSRPAGSFSCCSRTDGPTPRRNRRTDRGALRPLDDEAAQQLEEELPRLKAQLRATIEQYETQVEESKASNEELQAINEELRSAAEELETSKEELQSVNEELTTVNQELKIKIEELAVTNNNFQNLINSTEIGTIFLDRLLRVKLSTPRVRDIFNLLPLDAGRPLSDITSNLLDEPADRRRRAGAQHLQTIEREVQTRQGRWYLTRVLPYRTTEERIEGVVMTFLDITERRRAESRVRASEERLRLLSTA